MRWFKPESLVGALGELFLALPFLARFVEWALDLRIVRIGLGMANLGQAVDFAIQHLENPGWLGNVWLQLGIVIIGLLLIFWDRRRPSWLPSPELSPRRMIITGLLIILIGVIAGATLIGIGLRNHSIASTQAAATQVQQEKPNNVQPVFTTEDIRKMLVALGEMQTIVGTNVRNAYEATQFVSLDVLKKGGAPALVAKLQPIRDVMRQANKELTQLLFEYRYYDAELRPVLAGYDSALGWMDGSITPIIDDLNKYSSANADMLEALVRDRFVQWLNGRPDNFAKWYGSEEVKIANETKKIREWPRVVDTGQVISQAAQGPISIFAPEARATIIQWGQTFGTTRSVDLVFALFLDGKGPASKSVKLKDAYLQSGITGEIIKMKVGSTNPLEDLFSVSDANPVPPNGFIRLVAVINPSAPNQGIPNKKFFDDWKQTWFHAIYDDNKSDDILFDEKVMDSYFPELSGPHVTRRLDAEKN